MNSNFPTVDFPGAAIGLRPISKVAFETNLVAILRHVSESYGFHLVVAESHLHKWFATKLELLNVEGVRTLNRIQTRDRKQLDKLKSDLSNGSVQVLVASKSALFKLRLSGGITTDCVILSVYSTQVSKDPDLLEKLFRNKFSEVRIYPFVISDQPPETALQRWAASKLSEFKTAPTSANVPSEVDLWRLDFRTPKSWVGDDKSYRQHLIHLASTVVDRYYDDRGQNNVRQVVFVKTLTERDWLEKVLRRYAIEFKSLTMVKRSSPTCVAYEEGRIPVLIALKGYFPEQPMKCPLGRTIAVYATYKVSPDAQREFEVYLGLRFPEGSKPYLNELHLAPEPKPLYVADDVDEDEDDEDDDDEMPPVAPKSKGPKSRAAPVDDAFDDDARVDREDHEPRMPVSHVEHMAKALYALSTVVEELTYLSKTDTSKIRTTVAAIKNQINEIRNQNEGESLL